MSAEQDAVARDQLQTEEMRVAQPRIETLEILLTAADHARLALEAERDNLHADFYALTTRAESAGRGRRIQITEPNDWHGLRVGQWFYSYDSDCLHPHTVAERTDGGWTAVCTMTYANDAAAADARMIVKLHEEPPTSNGEGLALRRFVNPWRPWFGGVLHF